jgi:hypothetical protein
MSAKSMVTIKWRLGFDSERVVFATGGEESLGENVESVATFGTMDGGSVSIVGWAELDPAIASPKARRVLEICFAVLTIGI